MTLRRKIQNGISALGLAGVLTGMAIDYYNQEKVRDEVAERLELQDGAPVCDNMVVQFPELKERYGDNTGINYFTMSGILLLGIGVTGSTWRGVPGWASDYKNEEVKEK